MHTIACIHTHTRTHTHKTHTHTCNNVLYSSQQEIKAVIQSYTLMHVAIITYTLLSCSACKIVRTQAHTHMHVCMHTHTHARICESACAHKHTHAHTHTHTHTHTNKHAHMYTRMHKHMHAHTCAHTHTHTHTHTCRHTHAQSSTSSIRTDLSLCTNVPDQHAVIVECEEFHVLAARCKPDLLDPATVCWGCSEKEKEKNVV